MMHAAKLFRGNALRKGFGCGVFSQFTKIDIMTEVMTSGASDNPDNS